MGEILIWVCIGIMGIALLAVGFAWLTVLIYSNFDPPPGEGDSAP